MNNWIIKHIHGNILFKGHMFTSYDFAEECLIALGVNRDNYLISPLD